MMCQLMTGREFSLSTSTFSNYKIPRGVISVMRLWMKYFFHHTPRYFMIRKYSNSKLYWIQTIYFYPKNRKAPKYMPVRAQSLVIF